MSTPSRHIITVICPFCKTRVKIEELPAHKRTYHAQEVKSHKDAPVLLAPENTQNAKSPLLTGADMRLPSREFTSCPICTVRVKATRLNKHLNKVHPNARYPYQPPRVQEVKAPVRDGNLEDNKFERTVSSNPARRPLVPPSLISQRTNHPHSVNTRIGTPVGWLKSKTPKTKKAKPKKVKRATRASSRRWNISSAAGNARRFQNEDFGRPTPSPSYIVRKSYLDYVRVPEEKLDHCPHGVPRFRVCGICDPDKFREMTGMD
jgi:hypothetical protein